MNSVLSKYRELMPDDGRDDATLTYELGKAFEEKGVDFGASDPEFAKSYGFLKDLGTPSLGQEFVGGVKRGVDQMQSTYFGGAALVADALGWEGGREWAMEGYQRNQEQAAENPATIQSYKDVEGFGDGLRFATGLAGEVLPSGVEAVASGIASGGVGAPIAKQLIKRKIRQRIGKEATERFSGNLLREGVERATKSAAAKAATVGVTASSMLQNAGETYGELYESAATRGDRIKASFAAGAVAGALDAAVPVTVLRRIFPASVAKDMAEDQVKRQGLDLLKDQVDKAFEGYAPLKRKFLGALAKSTGGEAITESLQELVQEAAQAYADPDYQYDPAALRERLINAAIAGAVGGSQFGGATATIDTYRQSGVNKRLNDLSELYKSARQDYDSNVSQSLRKRQGAPIDLGDNQALEGIDLDNLPKEVQDLVDYISAQDAGGEGPVVAIIKYQDPESGEWRNAQARSESIEGIVETLQDQGIQNAEIVQISGERSIKISESEDQQDTAEPTEAEVKLATEQLRREGVKLDDYEEEDQQTILRQTVDELRERTVLGQVPRTPEPDRESILEVMREETAEVDADPELTTEEKADRKLEIELEAQEQLSRIGEEFANDGEPDGDQVNRGNTETQADGTNTPQGATESGQVTPSPVVAANPDIGIPISEQPATQQVANLEATYSDFVFMPAETLAGRDIPQELAAAHATVDSDGKPVKSKRFTRRAAVLRNTATGAIEVRGSYSTGKGKVHLHGSAPNSGTTYQEALDGWDGSTAKKGSRADRKIDRPPHELVGIIEFEGLAVPSDKDQQLFDKINEQGEITAEDQIALDGIARRRAGYGQIFETFPSIEAFTQATSGKFSEPRETMSERIQRGEIEVVNPGEYADNLESMSTAGIGLSESDTELIDPESLYLDEPQITDPQQATRTLSTEHGMPAAEIEQALDELDSIDSDGSFNDIASVFYSPDGGKTFPDFPAFTAHLQSLDEDQAIGSTRETFRLIQQLYRNARSQQNSEEGDGSGNRGAQAPVPDLRQAQRESGRTEGQDTGAAPAVPGQTPDPTADVPQRERQRPDADPQGDRSRRERALDWQRVGSAHTAFAGDLTYEVDGGPKVWDLRITDIADEQVLYNEAFIGDLDQAILAVESQRPDRSKAEPLAENAPRAVEVRQSDAQPDIRTPDDKPPLVVIQGDRIPQVTDRVGDAYPLDPVGKQGVNLALAAHANGRTGFINADSMGVGKSRQAIAVMQEIQQNTGGRVLYVTENAQQITKFEREMAVMGVTNPRIEMTTYNQIGRGKLTGRKFAAVVFDEAHNLKNATSDKSSGAAQIKSDFTMFMTATPMDKPEAAAYFISTITGQDEETVLREIGLERVAMERKDGSFYTKISKLGSVTNGEIRNRLNALRNRTINEGSMIRREYPFYGTRDVIAMELNEQQRAELDEINDYWDGQEKDADRNKDISRWLEAQKADEIYQRAKDSLAEGRSVVIVAESINSQWIQAFEGQTKKAAGGKTAKASRPQRGLGQILEEKFKADGIETSSIYGNSATDKTKAIDAFQSGQTKVAIMTPGSGGAGIDLDDQSGSNPRSVYVATMNFSGDVFEQIMGRFSRRNTMSPTRLSFVAAPGVSSDTHRAKVLDEKLKTLATFQGKEIEDQDADIRDIFSESVLGAPASPTFPLGSETSPIVSFNRKILPESRINTIEGIDYEIARVTQASPFLIDQHIDRIAQEFQADAGARTLIRNILEAIPGEKLQTLDLRIVEDPEMSAGSYDPARRLLILNKAASLNQGNGVALAFTHEMGHFYVNEIIGFDFVRDQWHSLSDKQRAASWRQYLEAQGAYVGDLDGASLVSNDTAAQEWAAFQFTRIARAGVRDRDTITKQMRKEGMSKGIIETLTSWYDQLRQWIDQWIGDAELSTTALDRAVINALGIETEESSMKADALRQQEFLKLRATQAGYATIEEYAIEDVRGFAESARAYRESKAQPALNAPHSTGIDRRGIVTPYEPPENPNGLLRGRPPQGSESSNRAIQEALAQARRSHPAARPAKLRLPQSYRDVKELERQVVDVEAKALIQWARANDKLIDHESFKRKWLDFAKAAQAKVKDKSKEIASGTESLVYFDSSSGAWIKRNAGIYHNNFTTLMRRIDAHNRIFPAAPLEFVGFSQGNLEDFSDLAEANNIQTGTVTDRGAIELEALPLQVVLRQRNVAKDRNAESEELSKWLKDRKFRSIGDGRYLSTDLGVIIHDLHEDNVVIENNEIVFIDPVISFPYPFEAPLQAPAGHRNPDIRRKLKDVDATRANDLVPEITGREEAGKKIVAENAWATHAELQQVALDVYDQARKQKLFDGDFDAFYRKFTATPVTPSEARKYLASLDVIGNTEVTREDLDADRQRNVDDYLLTELYETRNKLERRLREDSREKSSLESKIEQEQSRLERYQTQYNDAEALERGAVDEIKSYLAGFKKALGAKGGVAKLGRLGEIIRQLEGKKEIDNRIARKYTVGIERLVASEEPFVLFDLLEAVAESRIDLRGNATAVRNRFAEAGITSVASLSDEKFAAVLTIAQADRQLLDSIILRKLPDVEEKLAIVESEVAETKGDFKRSGKAITRIKRHAALKGRLAGQRALAKGRIARWQSQLRDMETNRKIADQAFKRYDAEFNKVAGRVGGTVQGHVTEGTNLFIPASGIATKADILAATRKFRYGETTPEDITRIIEAQRLWLEGPEGEDNRLADPVFYNQVLTQNTRLVERTFKEVHAKGTSLSKRLYFDSLANSFRALNLPGGNAIAQMLQKVEARTSAWRNEEATIGEQVDKSRYLLGRALGLDKTPGIFARRFADLVDTPMKDYMEQPGATIAAFIARDFADQDATTKRLIERYYEAELKNARFIRRVTEESMQQAGLGSVTNDRILVPDYANDGKLTALEQTHRNLGTGTFLIRPNMDVIGSIVQQFGDGEKIGSVMREIQNNEELSTSEAMSMIDQLFENRQDFDDIVGAIARKEKVPVFSNAQGALVARSEATAAFDAAETPSQFFENLYNAEGEISEAEFKQYLGEQLAEVYRLYNDIAKAEQEFRESKESPTSMRGHVAIDARKKDAWPAEWLSYRQGGATANSIIVSQNVIASVFGKDGERIRKEKASILSDLRGQILKAERDGDLKQKDRLQKELERANKYFTQLDHVLGSQLGPLRDIKLAMELMNTLVGGVLNGPRAAMVQLNQIYQPILHFGLSGTTFRMMKTQAKTAAQDLFGSFFEALGITIDRDSESFRMQKELFGLDPEKTNGYFGFTGDMGNEGRIGSAQRKVRLMNTMMSRRGISRAKAEDALYSSFKPWAPFSQLIGALHKAPMVAFRAEFDRLAGLAIAHADRVMPGSGDITTIDFNHRNLGFRSKTEFERLNTILQEKVGTTLADVVARHRANKGGAPYTRDQYLTMSSVGLDLMASEANVFTTRSPQMHTEMGRFVFPLLGWAIHQPHHAAKMFKGAEGEVTKRTIGAGLLTLSFGLVPAVMAMAMFEDWFDEEIMGKKRNLRPLTGAGPLGTANAVLERVTRNGMLGMPMEFANLALNIGGDGDLRTASLDQRVFLAGTIRGMVEIVGSVAHQKTLTWDSGGRRLLQNTGANGYLQQIDMFSTLLGLDNPESRTIARINANNYLRVGGRMIGLESRPFSGSVRPTPITPWVTKMQIAAQANDAQSFQSAYLKALEAARKHLDKTGPREAEDYIAQNWSSRHPLKGPFRSPPTPGEYQSLLKAIGQDGARDVQELVNQYNRFGQRIGAKPYTGKQERRSSNPGLSMRSLAGFSY